MVYWSSVSAVEKEALKEYNKLCSSHIGMSPSGKALGSGSSIRGFESLHPSQERQFEMRPIWVSFVIMNLIRRNMYDTYY